MENLKEKLPAAARPYRAVAGRWALGGGGRQEEEDEQCQGEKIRVTAHTGER